MVNIIICRSNVICVVTSFKIIFLNDVVSYTSLDKTKQIIDYKILILILFEMKKILFILNSDFNA
jgi:hypothetical protein